LSSRHTVRRSFTGYIEVYFSLRRSMTVLLRNRNEAYKCFWICCHSLDEVYEIPVLCLFCCVCITMSLCRSFVIEWLVYSHTTFISSGRYRIIICEYEQKLAHESCRGNWCCCFFHVIVKRETVWFYRVGVTITSPVYCQKLLPDCSGN